MGKGDDLEKFHIQSAKDFNIVWFVKWFKKLQSLGVASLVLSGSTRVWPYAPVQGSRRFIIGTENLEKKSRRVP